MPKHVFKTEVSQLLHLIIHSLYSNKEIFLRELISNSSDALDKLKFLTITDKKFKNIDFSPRIDIAFSNDKKTLTISDNGLGMNKTDLTKNLGTIARSGTKNFLDKLSGDSKRDSNLIGQFGVGFYSCFMIADKVEVSSKKAGESKSYNWKSDGKTGFSISNGDKDKNGTSIVLYLNDEGVEFANRWRIDGIIKKYSNHVSFPIFLHYTEESKDEAGNLKIEQKCDQMNEASAFWKKTKSSLKEEDYNEFYKTLTNDFEEPMLRIHTQAEGTLDYTTLFYIPSKAQFDLFQSDYKSGIKLYVKRVFITDDDKELMPTYLRFIRGVIDTEDLPLNVSREILQQNQVLAKIKKNSVKKILSELSDLSKDKDKYMIFFNEYGKLIKEGVYQDFENREELLDLLRYKSNQSEGLVSFNDYTNRMNEEQKIIYYICGNNENTLKQSPLIEMYNKKNIEVLILDDEIDEIVVSSINKYKDWELKAVNKLDAADDLDEIDDQKKDKFRPLTDKIKKILKDKVKNVSISNRLMDSPSCIVVDQNDPSIQMQEIMKKMGNMNSAPEVKPILEINPDHKIISKMNKMGKTKKFEDACYLLFDQALLIEGLDLSNPSDFVSRLNSALEKSL